jgi:hypothetical protein
VSRNDPEDRKNQNQDDENRPDPDDSEDPEDQEDSEGSQDAEDGEIDPILHELQIHGNLINEQNDLLDSIDGNLAAMVSLQRDMNDYLKGITRTSTIADSLAGLVRALKEGKSTSMVENLKDARSAG